MFIPSKEITIVECLQTNTLPTQRGGTPTRNVTLPHQALYGAIPQLDEQSLNRLVADELKADGSLEVLQTKWKDWKGFLSGVDLHSLSDDLLDKTLSSEFGSIDQAINLRKCHDDAILKLNAILDSYTASIGSKFRNKGQVICDGISQYIESNLALSIESTFYERFFDTAHSERAALALVHNSGVSVVDIDLARCPKPLRDLAIVFIQELTIIGGYCCSTDLFYQMSHDVDLIEHCQELSFLERDKLKGVIYDDDIALDYLIENHSELVDECKEMYGDTEYLIYNLRDVLDINFDINKDNRLKHLHVDGDVKASLLNIQQVLQYWLETQNPIISHPIHTKIVACISIILEELKPRLVNAFHICSDASVSDLRIISFDFDNDKSAIESVSNYHNDMCEDAALTIDLTNKNAIEVLKQYRLVDQVLGVLVSE
ncbi:hypothetical protein [Pseudoalteromonas sp. MQS005]|uniref:hypothetical protein n=1 Tax=Pseudoalteromonas sp. MQS005 TaxID=1854052 RepID=UPI0007E4E0EE|nr:hypothetical protein [Pseudoalteromonas sp. MQS005]